ncbi:MAG: dephospho-CoA kinase [Senegalia sp. (in: firmicutes)]|uniref:dephospho-CoA kinase n=1 Tax=Senegalia sp. (in: firmicutes) TaxID=1924098 RepID=UPI003F9E3EE7
MKQNDIKIIGLTGGIATGKSTVSNMLKECRYIVIDADEIARVVVEKNKPAYNDILNLFGKDILNDTCEIDRAKLGQIIFNDENLRDKLNDIVHPRIYEKIKEEIKTYKNQGENIIFIDIPLLIEIKEKLSKEDIVFDEIWLVYLDKKNQVKRLIQRNNYLKKEANIRINSQMDIEEKIKYCDRIIDNSKDIKNTKKQLIKELKNI